MVPGWEVLFTRTFLSLADYWGGGLGVPSVLEGAERSTPPPSSRSSAIPGTRSFASMSASSLARSSAPCSASSSRPPPWTRRLIDLPVQLLRTLPLLAMVPLFQLWFGTYFVGKVAFVAYGVGVLFVAGTINAVKNIPPIYIDNARTLGAGTLDLYRTVIIPAIFPELRATILLSLGTAWATVIGAEYLGAQSGLGYILVYSQQFGYVDRMFFVALLFILYASISYALFNRLSQRLLQWAPRSAGRPTTLA